MRLTLERLNPATFASFGTVIANPAIQAPAPRDASTLRPISANQGTALKYSPIAPLTDAYGRSSLPSRIAPFVSRPRSKPRMSLFVCAPRALDVQGNVTQPVLERHPYTTQAFVPLGLSAADRETAFVVIVAPAGGRGPDVAGARAFLARGDQAVVYGVGTWHAPMVVVGARAIAFVVVQFVNGVPADDCVEWELEGDEVVEVGLEGALGRYRAKL